MSHIFGPVASRRLGRSLGVDVVPFKTCTYDCIYCQLGRTTCKTAEIKDWVPLEQVLADLTERLCSQPDYITLSGSGEPTLFSRIGELIRRIKAMTHIPVAVLTNGSLLWREDVRDQLMDADLVMPSLDAGDGLMFRAVNRPCREISFEKMVGGLVDFRREFQGQYWLEVLLLANYTATERELSKLAECVKRIEPDKVQLNTVIRPPVQSSATGVPYERMVDLAKAFDPPAEVIMDFRDVGRLVDFSTNRDSMLNMLARRPCSIEDIASGLGIHQNEVVKYINELTAENLVAQSLVEGRLYYKAK